MPNITSTQLNEMVDRTRNVLNGAGDAYDNSELDVDSYDYVVAQLEPIFTAANEALDHLAVDDDVDAPEDEDPEDWAPVREPARRF